MILAVVGVLVERAVILGVLLVAVLLFPFHWIGVRVMRFLRLFLAVALVLVLSAEATAQCRTCRPSSGRPRLFPRVFAPSATLAPTYYRPAPSYGYSAPSFQPAPVHAAC